MPRQTQKKGGLTALIPQTQKVYTRTPHRQFTAASAAQVPPTDDRQSIEKEITIEAGLTDGERAALEEIISKAGFSDLTWLKEKLEERKKQLMAEYDLACGNGKSLCVTTIRGQEKFCERFWVGGENKKFKSVTLGEKLPPGYDLSGVSSISDGALKRLLSQGVIKEIPPLPVRSGETLSAHP